MTRTNLAIAAVGMVLVAGAAVALVLPGGGAAAQTADQQNATASVAFENQTVEDGTVVVDSANLSDGGFVVVHDEGLADGDAVGSVIGVSTYLEAGTHEDVEITLARSLEGNGTATLTAMPHRDTNDNQVYDFVISNGSADGPYTANGSAVVDAAEVTAGEPTPTPTQTNETELSTGSVTFDDQAAEDGTVVVDSANLSEGGFVAVYQGSAFGDEAVQNVVGVSGYLEAGTHEDVEITLAGSLNATDGNVTLTAMPHRDTNDNQVYDFVISNGSVDDSYTTAVLASAVVSIEEGAAGNETATAETAATPTVTTATATPTTVSPSPANATATP